MKRLLIILCTSLLACVAYSQNQSTQTFFGKNRVQFKDFNWTYFSSTQFDVFFYDEGRTLAQRTAKHATRITEEIEDFMNYKIDGRYQFIVYRKQSDLMQTNLGLDLDQYNTGGFTKIVGNKVLLHFNGDWKDFEEQLRAGILRVLIFEMLYGGSLQEKIRNSSLIYLPDWYLDGLLSYIKDYWSPNDDEQLRQWLRSPKIKKFNHLIGLEPQLAGKSFWYFIDRKYGPGNISNLIYLTRINRDFEQALVYVLGKPLKGLSSEWLEFYKSQYADWVGSDEKQKEYIIKKFKRGTKVGHLSPSPAGTLLAYTTHRKGISTIFIKDLDNDKTYKVHRSGLKHQELYNPVAYPILTWHPNGRSLSYFYDKKGQIEYGNVDLSILEELEKEEKLLPKLDDVLSADFHPNGRSILISGTRNGQSDLYSYTPRANRLTPVTQDEYDDLDAIYLMGGKRIAFQSSRPLTGADTISTLAREIFLLNPEKNTFTRLTRSYLGNESHLTRVSDTSFFYLSDESGITNRYQARVDSFICRYDTLESDSPFLELSPIYCDTSINIAISNRIDGYNWQAHSVAEGLIYSGISERHREWIITEEIDGQPDQTWPAKTPYRIWTEELLIEQASFEKKGEQFEQEDGPLLKSQDYEYQVELDLPQTPGEQGIDLSGAKAVKLSPLDRTKARVYHSRFSTDYLVSQFGNSLVQNNIPTFLISSLNSLTQRPGFIIMAGTSDLFEDYKISGGLRFSTEPNNEVFLMYEDLRKRWDKKVVFHQHRFRFNEDNDERRTTIHEGMVSFRYPTNPFLSIQLNGIVRRDQTDILSTDQSRLTREPQTRNWAGVRTELIYDNTKNVQLNILNGTRYKLFAETYNEIGAGKGLLSIVGTDVRNYLPIYRNFIWANRFAANASFGKQKMLYYLGGVDGWLFPRFDSNLGPPEGEDFAFEAYGTNMRGFPINARNGSNYFVFNSELRLPIFSFFSRSPISSDFFRNFQIVGFADVGTAWSGFNPFSQDNPFNIEYFQFPPAPQDYTVRVKVITDKNPLLLSYGGGLRARLFGYFVRADMGWGVDDGQVLKPQFHFSLSLDF